MCGLAGIIFGVGPREPADLAQLMAQFTRLLALSQQRGPHATGIALLNQDGRYRLFKRPLAATQFVEHKSFRALLGSVDDRTTLLLGHTRWRTRGDERVNRNNHPIRAGHVLGIHNGTIYNADDLFRRYRLPRFADVDSELLFRIARTTPDGRVDVPGFRKRLSNCRGQIAAVMASRRDPNIVLLLKGNNPLELRWNARLRVLFYASAGSYLDKVRCGGDEWTELVAPAMTLLRFRRDELPVGRSTEITFLAQATERTDDFARFRQLSVDDV